MSALSASGRELLKNRISDEVRRSMVRFSYNTSLPLSEEHLAARAEFVAKWKDMCDEGERLNYLEWSNDYPGSTLEAVIVTSTIGPRAFYETDEQWEQKLRTEINRRVKAEVARIDSLIEGSVN